MSRTRHNKFSDPSRKLRKLGRKSELEKYKADGLYIEADLPRSIAVRM